MGVELSWYHTRLRNTPKIFITTFSEKRGGQTFQLNILISKIIFRKTYFKFCPSLSTHGHASTQPSVCSPSLSRTATCLLIGRRSMLTYHMPGVRYLLIWQFDFICLLSVLPTRPKWWEGSQKLNIFTFIVKLDLTSINDTYWVCYSQRHLTVSHSMCTVYRVIVVQLTSG